MFFVTSAHAPKHALNICQRQPAAAPCSGTSTTAPKRGLPWHLAGAPCSSASTQARKRALHPAAASPPKHTSMHILQRQQHPRFNAFFQPKASGATLWVNMLCQACDMCALSPVQPKSTGCNLSKLFAPRLKLQFCCKSVLFARSQYGFSFHCFNFQPQ